MVKRSTKTVWKFYVSETAFEDILKLFRAAGEGTRLRILALLAYNELTVTELTEVLCQSQPRVSRHLKILTDAELVIRYREGAWVFYRLAERQQGAAHLEAIHLALRHLAREKQSVLIQDRTHLRRIYTLRATKAASYFQANAEKWDELRQLYLPQSDVEQAMRDLIGPAPVSTFLDLGTGTGRMLIAFADMYTHGIGLDISREMLAVAGVNLENAGILHAKIQKGDIFNLPLEVPKADLVCIHHVLHYLSEPALAISGAAALLAPGGRLLISDFATHALDFLRDEHAHHRLGFDDTEVAQWCHANALVLQDTRSLSPHLYDARAQLTVKFWLCKSAS